MTSSRPERPGTTEHDELDLLLPWYVNGTLDTEESERVRAHLADCESCRRNVEFLGRMRDVTRHERLAAIAPAPSTDALLARIDRDDRRHAARRRYASLAMAAGVAAVAVSALFVFLGRAPQPQAPQVFETATTPPLAATGIDYIFDIDFDPRATAAERRRIIESFGARELGPGEQAAAVRIAAAVPAANADELNGFMLRLTQHEQVRAARLVAIQIPAR